MDYKLIRSKRKTIAIYIRDNEVEVRTPLNMLTIKYAEKRH